MRSRVPSVHRAFRLRATFLCLLCALNVITYCLRTALLAHLSRMLSWGAFMIAVYSWWSSKFSLNPSPLGQSRRIIQSCSMRILLLWRPKGNTQKSCVKPLSTKHRALKFGVYSLVNLYIKCSNYFPGIKTGPRPRGPLILQRFRTGNFVKNLLVWNHKLCLELRCVVFSGGPLSSLFESWCSQSGLAQKTLAFFRLKAFLSSGLTDHEYRMVCLDLFNEIYVSSLKGHTL